MNIYGKRYITTGFIILLIIGSGKIYTYRKAFSNDSPPQVIMVLGGDVNREFAGINIAKKYNKSLIISGGSNPEYAEWLIDISGISPDLVRLDYRATDTLSNFTSLIDELGNRNISHILAVTDEVHLRRASMIGTIVAGSRGIRLSTLAVKCKGSCEKESLQKQMLDVFRSIVWVISGKDPKDLFKSNLNTN